MPGTLSRAVPPLPTHLCLFLVTSEMQSYPLVITRQAIHFCSPALSFFLPHTCLWLAPPLPNAGHLYLASFSFKLSLRVMLPPPGRQIPWATRAC